MADSGPSSAEPQAPDLARENERLGRALQRAEETLENYEHIVDQSQHLLNTRIAELEEARRDLGQRTEELEESESRFKQLAAAAFEGVIIHEGGVILDANKSARILHGLDRIVGKKLADLLAPVSAEVEQRHRTDTSGEPYEAMHVRADRSTFAVEVRSKTVVYHGRPARVMAMRDITERRRLEDELRHLARTDPLTGVANRRHLLELGEGEVLRARRYGHPLSVMMIDVDHFKNVNDSHGHAAGDLVLRTVAALCVEELRTIDNFGRMGGEEFAVIMPETGRDDALAVAERLRASIARSVVDVSGRQISSTVSVGVSSLLADDDMSSLLSRADTLLYSAKRKGRDRVLGG